MYSIVCLYVTIIWVTLENRVISVFQAPEELLSTTMKLKEKGNRVIRFIFCGSVVIFKLMILISYLS